MVLGRHSRAGRNLKALQAIPGFLPAREWRQHHTAANRPSGLSRILPPKHRSPTTFTPSCSSCSSWFTLLIF